ncbi:GH25 family lysozyme [Paenibacillus sp. OV219]|uniref:GH25 family lysozyme n=1 Tax=Paenibacillus sp. OV219 TaxID=1884377 RepID=UPI0008C2A557|nr:GH25 family lysozyme [Paenibacillus sp. OV219]SEO60565.1 Lyzozyme M1 (1,4-beta-N-acetylmuramidase), GH25 family [Paenibacillus sp. OV219]
MQARSASNVKVIDVSHHNGIIDWKKVKADGVMGVFIKASEGTTFVDDKFKTNANEATAAGIKVGFYHYVHPESNNAKSEAAHFASVVSGVKTDFPHVLDVEGDAEQVSVSKLTQWCVDWLQEVEQLTNHPTMLYTGAYFARDNLTQPLGQWPLWIAHYGVTTPLANDTWSEWSVFQFSENERVSGIGGDVDMNAMEQAFWNKYANPNVPQPLSPEDDVKVVVNDQLSAFGRIIDGSTFAPLRQLGDSLGIPVSWDSSTSTPYFDGKPVTNFKLIDSRTYIGVRLAGEMLGATTIKWDSVNRKVYIYY